MHTDYDYSYNPERSYIESGVEIRVNSSEQVDMLHAIEYLLNKIVEEGPELDPAYRDYLKQLLQDALNHLNDFLTDNAADDEDVMQAVDDAREQLDKGIGQEVKRIMAEFDLPALMREVVESVLIGRAEGRQDSAIYRQLARKYHPDQTLIDPQDAEEMFKLVGQLVWDGGSGRFVF